MIYDWFELEEPISCDGMTITAVEVEAGIEDFESVMRVHRVKANDVERKADDFGISVSDIDSGTMDTIMDAVKDDYNG